MPCSIGCLDSLDCVIICPSGSELGLGPAPLKIIQNRKSPITGQYCCPELPCQIPDCCQVPLGPGLLPKACTPWTNAKCLYALDYCCPPLRPGLLPSASSPWTTAKCLYALDYCQVPLRPGLLPSASMPWTTAKCL